MPPQPTRVLELRSVRGTGGGPEKTIMLGAARADRARTEITVCYLRDQRDQAFRPADRAADLGIRYEEIVERHSFDAAIWPSLVRLVRARGIDVVHAHEYKTDLLAWLLARRTGVAAMATAHGWTGHSGRERHVYYPLDKRLLARFPRVVAVSGGIKDELVAHGARADRVTVLLNAIDPNTFQRSAGRRAPIRAALGYRDTDIVMGGVGRLEPQKRFDLLIDAFAQVSVLEPRLSLVIVGDGSLRPSLERQAERLGLGTRCRFLGHQTDLIALHHALDVFVQASDYEGTPNAVLEAMAMETPVIATDAGGTRELAAPDVHGLIVPTGSAACLRDAIVRALGDPGGTLRRVAQARARVEQDLSFDARSRRLEAIYAELAEQRRSGGHAPRLPAAEPPPSTRGVRA